MHGIEKARWDRYNYIYGRWEKEKMIVFVVTGYNGVLQAYCPVGVATTRPLAEKIVRDHASDLDESLISEMEPVSA